MLRTTIVTAALLGGSVLVAAAQSQTAPSAGMSNNSNISPTTHCIDQTTHQPRLKSANSGGSGSPAAAGSARGSTDRSNPSSAGASGPAGGGTSGRATTGSATTGSGSTAGLSPC